VAKLYAPGPPEPAAPLIGTDWATFIKNHAHEMWACDFLQSYDLFFGTIFLFFIIESGSRRVVHFNVTRVPSDAWMAQQLREATPYGKKPIVLNNLSEYRAIP
jgi:putative transposase